MCFIVLFRTGPYRKISIHFSCMEKNSIDGPKISPWIFFFLNIQKNTWTVLRDLSNTVFVSANRKCISVLKWCSVLHYRQLTSKFTTIFTFTDWRLLYKVNYYSFPPTLWTLLCVSSSLLDLKVLLTQPFQRQHAFTAHSLNLSCNYLNKAKLSWLKYQGYSAPAL